MVLSWKESKKFILDPELESTYKQKDSADTAVPVRREVQERQECPLKSFGSEDKEFWEDFWESIELQRRSIELFITDSTSPPRVTNSRTKLSWLKPSSSKRLKRSMPKSLKCNKTPEELRTWREEKEELRSPKDYDWGIFKNLNLLFLLMRGMEDYVLIEDWW